MRKEFSLLEKKIGYVFKDKSLLMTALTHSSYSNENKDGRQCNERLEFLGDSVLQLISAEYLYSIEKGDEGDLSKERSALVCEDALCEYAQALGIGDYLYLGRGEEYSGRTRKSTLADATEALIAAIFLDSDFDHAKAFILPYLKEKSKHLRTVHDYKSILQEVVQKNKGEKLSYQLAEEHGPDHDKTFIVEVLINSNHISRGEGKSKKDAAQEAARIALEMMGIELK